MLAELAVATAAFKTVKEFLSNGKELYEMGDQLMNYFDAKNKLQKEVNKSNKSDKSDLEEFMALEQIKAQEDELRELMIYTGRPGMWQDWIKFQSEAARRREEAKKEALRQKAKRDAQIYQWFEIGVSGLLVIGAVGIIAWVFWLIASA
tara:strand:+ start:148 stop:594 length:447 start_codon:yes stop_codon:yes gene_type:complete